MNDRPHVELENRAQWREWLSVNHATSGGVWLVTARRRTGRPTITYEEAVEEALCFGWIDGQLGKGDEETTWQWYAPRRLRSTWARTNKERVARLEAAGLMMPSGLEAVARARANGAWNSLDAIDALTMPPDLEVALAEREFARDRWDASTASQRRQALAWVTMVKRPTTRAAHVAQVADTLARGETLSSIWRRD